MASSGYNYDYLPLAWSRKKDFFRTFAAGTIILFVVNFIVLKWLAPPPSVLDTFHPLNSLSPVREDVFQKGASDASTFDLPGPKERAVVTTLYSESYSDAVITLGHSLQGVGTASRLIVLYFPDRLSNQTHCRLKEVGWELHAIAPVPPPNGGKGVYYRYFDQYSKLRLWTLDSIGIRSVIYLDGDTLVLRNFDELWQLPFQFGAVPDVYWDKRGFTLRFNAGVLFLRTSTAIFHDMLSKIASTSYNHRDAEQGFLNVYFASQVVRLPYIYNANLAMKQRNSALWKAIQKDISVVHYTMMKPFIEEERNKAIGGIWESELEQWISAWEDVSNDLRGKC